MREREKEGERETYTWSSRFGQLNDEVSNIPNIDLSEGRSGRSFKQRLYDWKVHFTKELSMTSENEQGSNIERAPKVSKLHIIIHRG